MASIEMWSEAKIALGRELNNHPKILEEIEAADVDDYPNLLATVAAHFNIIMEGYYAPLQLDILADKLYHKLVASRSGLKTPLIGIPL